MKLKAVLRQFLVVAVSLLATFSAAWAAEKNGFNLDNSIISVGDIRWGGPPKDGIPSIDKPKFVSANKADYLKETDRVLGLSLNGVERAYPINILNWHEIVNDSVGGEPVVVSFCPLCGTGMVFKPFAQDKQLEFGVSGLLYQSDMLLYDRETESLWSQISRTSVAGELVGTELELIPFQHTTWKAWLAAHPNTEVLSEETGFYRNYRRDPYEGYADSRRIMFPVNNESELPIHPKEQVVGLEIDGQFKAYPFSELAKMKGEYITDKFAGESVKVWWDDQAGAGWVTDEKNEAIATVTAFWFAWFAFHPGTLVHNH